MFLTLYQVLGCLQAMAVVGHGEIISPRWENHPKIRRCQWNWAGFKGNSIKQSAQNSLTTCSWWSIKFWDVCVTDNEEDYERAIKAFQQVLDTETGAPIYRIYAGLKIANLLVISDIQRAMESVTQAVKLLPQASPWILKQTDQQDILKLFSAAASYASALILNETEDSLRGLQILELE